MAYIIHTYSGLKVDLEAPKPDQISIVDIAHGLSHVPRFSGQQSIVRTVAEHCINVASDATRVYRWLHKDASTDFELKCLLHDASEAYICDIPHPLKQILPDYKRVEERLQTVIYQKFGLYPWTTAEYEAFKEVDLAQHDYERTNLPKLAYGAAAKTAYLEYFLKCRPI